MPDPYPNVRYGHTKLAIFRLNLLGLSINDAIHVVRNYGESWQGRKPGQMWFRGHTLAGRSLKVLIGKDSPSEVVVITAEETE